MYLTTNSAVHFCYSFLRGLQDLQISGVVIHTPRISYILQPDMTVQSVVFKNHHSITLYNGNALTDSWNVMNFPDQKTCWLINNLVKLHCTWTHTYTHPFNSPLSGTTQVSRYQKGKTNLDFTEARDSEWQWHQVGHMQVCTSLQKDNHASTPPLKFYRPDALPATRPTASKRWRQNTAHEQRNKNDFNEIRQTLSPVNETIHYIYLHGQ